MAETKPTGAKKHITGARIAQEIKQYKKDALISPLYTVCCVILEILIPYLTASIIDKGIAVGNMAHVAKIGTLMAVMAILAMFFGVRAGVHSARASAGAGEQSARIHVRADSGIFLLQHRQVLHRGACHAPDHRRHQHSERFSDDSAHLHPRAGDADLSRCSWRSPSTRSFRSCFWSRWRFWA